MVKAAVLNDDRQQALWRFKITVLCLLICDVLLLLFLTYGSVFPSRMAIKERGLAMPDQLYDYAAKASPFAVAHEKKQVAQAVSKAHRRSMPPVASVQPAFSNSAN